VIKNKKILVTGAGGFIGSSLVERLVELGAKVTALVEYNSNLEIFNLVKAKKEIIGQVEIVFGDIRDFMFINELVKGKNIVFNLAALIDIPYSYRSPGSYIHTNILGSYNILESCKNNDVELLVQTSTSEVYGTPESEFIKENHRLNAQSPYAATKIAADQLSHSYYCSYGLPVVIIRPFNTYGPRQSLRALIPSIIRQAMNGNKIVLGNLNTTRDYTYIDDTVEGFIKSIEIKDRNAEVYNLGTGREYSVTDIINIVSKKLNKSIVIVQSEELIRPTNSEVLRLKSDNRKMVNETGWKPKISMETGLINIIDKWADNNK
jgi:NAD dependent epimerase/dehydratase